MIVDMEVKASAEEIFKRFGYLWKFLDVDKKRSANKPKKAHRRPPRTV